MVITVVLVLVLVLVLVDFVDCSCPLNPTRCARTGSAGRATWLIRAIVVNDGRFCRGRWLRHDERLSMTLRDA
jgi:hypothetical protein